MLQQTEDAFLEVPLANSPNIQMTGGLIAKRRAARLRWTATHSNVKTLSSSATQSFLTQAETFPVPSDGCKCKRSLTLFPFLFFFFLHFGYTFFKYADSKAVTWTPQRSERYRQIRHFQKNMCASNTTTVNKAIVAN